ncbi:glycoside hydrolase family 27 protein [Streptomyces sp. NPDC091272]|uniref:glycoside hydrolase family 27 protein n=1 Tax=Streptomyces sp. NPDC091272 TaxID=3365981 RepID=UPI003824B1CD
MPTSRTDGLARTQGLARADGSARTHGFARAQRRVRTRRSVRTRRPVLAALCALAALAAAQFTTAPSAAALDNGQARTPAMGWNSWNAFRCDIDEQKIRAAADALVGTGLREAGYRYVNIDDCWQAPTRDAEGRLRADPARFPGGIAALADYVHDKGLKLGLYATPGRRTCANIWHDYPGSLGSLGHEYQDAETFAGWGVDYLKYDWCYAGKDGVRAEPGFTTMRDALAATGRPMLFSIHHEPQLPVWDWRPQVANSWRVAADIRDNWQSMIGIVRINQPLAAHAGPGAWNDPDMLEVGNGGMTDAEYRTHFGLWAQMAAPLLISTDLTAATPRTLRLLANRDVIAVDQDPLGRQGTVVSREDGLVVMTKPLVGGARSVTLTNETDATATVSTTTAAAGLKRHDSYAVKNLWTGRESFTAGTLRAEVPAHDTVMYRVAPDPTGAAADR